MCILLNRTRAGVVSRVLPALFERCPRYEAMANAGKDLEEILRPCGLARRRAATLRTMSTVYPHWAATPYEEPESLPGVGKYAGDSYRILFLGERPDVSDRALARYLREVGIATTQERVDRGP